MGRRAGRRGDAPHEPVMAHTVNYDEAVNGWLGGVNNMKTEVWWADHNQKRKKE